MWQSESAAKIDGSAVLLSRTVTATAPSRISKLSRHGPGVYSRALVTVSLTTSRTMPIVRADTGKPCTAYASDRKTDRPAIPELDTDKTETDPPSTFTPASPRCDA
ncbi:hypothetical protein ADL02_30955 [Streptomyces sp. NRRL WC-3723]|nr:hypothetical protein ADL02_30955 [Streptomyces sp. NRRL WC-3723]